MVQTDVVLLPSVWYMYVYIKSLLGDLQSCWITQSCIRYLQYRYQLSSVCSEVCEMYSLSVGTRVV